MAPAPSRLQNRRASIHSKTQLYSKRTGNKTLKVTPIEDDLDHCYVWTRRGEPQANGTIHIYACQGCLKIYDKAKGYFLSS